MSKIKPSDFNRRIVLRAYDYTQGDSGGITSSLKESVKVWAKVENRSGVTLINQAQQQWDYDYKVTVRYQPKFNSNWVIDYELQRLTINSVSVESEGYKRYMIFKCSTKEQIESWS